MEWQRQPPRFGEVSQAEFGRPVSANNVIRLFRQSAKALDFLNARKHVIGGFPGRSPAPRHQTSNLLVFGDTVKLCDFGLATMIARRTVLHDSAGTPA